MRALRQRLSKSVAASMTEQFPVFAICRPVKDQVESFSTLSI